MGSQASKWGASPSVEGGAEATPALRDRRGDLLRAATEIVREVGFGGASVKAVTARAGVSAGLLYSYANNSDELLCEVFRRCAGVELAAVDTAVNEVALVGGTAVLRLVTLVDTFAERALRGRSLARALLVEPVSQAIEIERHTYRRSYADMMTEIVAFGVHTNEFAPQNPRVTAAGLIGAISEAIAGPLSPLSSTPGTPGTPESAESPESPESPDSAGSPESPDSPGRPPTQDKAHTSDRLRASNTEYDERVVTLIRDLCLRAVGAQAGADNWSASNELDVNRDDQGDGEKP